MLRIASILGLALPLLISHTGWAHEAAFSRDRSLWGRFTPGTWKRVRLITETLDREGNPVNTTTTTTQTVLQDVDEDSYTLLNEGQVEIAGKQIDIEPNTAKYAFHGGAANDNPRIAIKKTERVVVEGKPYDCKVVEVVTSDGTQKRRTTAHINDNLPPFILRRAIKSTDLSGKKHLIDTTEAVVAINMPHRVGNDILMTSYVKTVRSTPKGQTVTFSVQAPDVPGGVVEHTAWESDAQGWIVRRSRMELLKFGFPKEGVGQPPSASIREERVSSRRRLGRKRAGRAPVRRARVRRRGA